jgi:hypothetical protein
MATGFSRARSVTTLVAPPAATASLAWQVSVLFETGGRSVVNEGRKPSDGVTDVFVTPVPGGERYDARTVSVRLGSGFLLSVNVSRQIQIDGFGLFIGRRGYAHGFSWEWFDRAGATIFEKRQGHSRVAATIRRIAGCEELVAIEFLEDVALRYLDDVTKPPGTHTHEVIVRKGSIFKLTL